ncbi:MAG: glycosyltransferase family 4 protein [Bryobacteraceae bacterium]|nr:glycosyltransferase family 4 protein [Bryobacteraceae bacterium]MDW8378658.1 glycosyltransferase family 4 protein [Bryobacterales bacterium]
MASILFLSPEAPYPLAGGGCYRTASLLEFLARRYDLDLVLFAVAGASDPEASLPRGLARNVFKLRLPAHSKRWAPRVARNVLRLARGIPPLVDRYGHLEAQLKDLLQGRRYDLGWIEHFWCAPYWEVLKPACRQMVLDLHNLESEWFDRAAEIASGPLAMAYRRFAARCLSLERKWIPRFDHVLVPSERELAKIPYPHVRVYPNSIPWVVQPPSRPDQSIVFSGNLEYRPNQDAVRFFARNVWPRLRRRWPNLIWRIVGKNPAGVARELAGDPRIVLTGPVADATTELAQSQVAIVPVRSGSGTRVKILEAWAAGLPVVSTALGAEGLQAIPGVHFLTADSAEDFLTAISLLLEAKPERMRLGSAGRRLYEERYTWEAAWKLLQGEKFLPP